MYAKIDYQIAENTGFLKINSLMICLQGLVPGLIPGDTCIYETPVNYRE